MRIINLNEGINKYYRYTLFNPNTQRTESFFIGLGKWLKELYAKDGSGYDELNYALGQLEYTMMVPMLDYSNRNYNFAFTKKALDSHKMEFNNLFRCIKAYTPFEVKIQEVELDDKTIVYQDEMQVAYEV